MKWIWVVFILFCVGCTLERLDIYSTIANDDVVIDEGVWEEEPRKYIPAPMPRVSGNVLIDCIFCDGTAVWTKHVSCFDGDCHFKYECENGHIFYLKTR
jgi:hypothetical protein